MSAAGIANALSFVLRWEGGLVDDPEDPGQRTNRGITQQLYDAWRRRQGLPTQGFESMAAAEIRAIYESHYWTPPRCDLLDEPLGLVQFDTAVHMGVGRAVRLLQSAAGCSVDGSFGPGTERAVAGCDHGTLMAHYCDAREVYCRKLAASNPRLGQFLRGWLNRLNALRKAAGLAGFESALDFAAGQVRRIPDFGIDARFDV